MKMLFVLSLFICSLGVSSAQSEFIETTEEKELQKSYVIDKNVTASNWFSADVSVNELLKSAETSSEICQTIQLTSGWNIFSAYVNPVSADMKEIFQNSIDQGNLIKIQGENGKTLEDWGIYKGWQNNIGEITPIEGYHIKLNTDENIEICGNPVNYPFAVPLKAGWNIIGYPRAAPQNGMDILQPLIDSNSLARVEDEAGKTIEYSGSWQNNIGDFMPGKGYRIYMAAADTLWIKENYENNYELQVRSGLPNFFKKVKNNESVNVVYFGGSITAAEGWRPQTADWMRSYFSNSNINDFNASIGGTTSEFGAYRLGRDVLPHSPDLVLVEFAVNDADRNYTDIIRSMEGIVRQVKNADSNTELCFVYTVKSSTLDSIPPDNLHKTVQAMEEVAEHYQIPTIHFGLEVKTRVDNEELIFKGSSTYIDGIPVFSSDGIHPYPETGHVVYTEVFKRSIRKMETSSVNPKIYPAPLREDNLVNAKMLALSKISLVENWEPLSTENFPEYDNFSDRASGAMFTATPGDKMHFRFKGTKFGLTDIIGPRSGYLEVVIDDSVVVTIKRFDGYCSYYRVHFFTSKELADTEHEVTITLLDADIDKRSVLNDDHKPVYDEDPSAFEGEEWYPIRLLINGDLIIE